MRSLELVWLGPSGLWSIIYLHSQVEAGQPVEGRKVRDEEPRPVRGDVLDQFSRGLVPHLQVVDLAGGEVSCRSAEDQQALPGLIVERAGETTGGVLGLDHLVPARGQALALR